MSSASSHSHWQEDKKIAMSSRRFAVGAVALLAAFAGAQFDDDDMPIRSRDPPPVRDGRSMWDPRPWMDAVGNTLDKWFGGSSSPAKSGRRAPPTREGPNDFRKKELTFISQACTTAL